MKYISNIFLSCLLLSCSSLVEVEKSNDLVGVERLSIDQKNYEKPQFYMDDFKFRAGRSIASVEEFDTEEEPKLSSRELYFLTYLKQHLILGSALGYKKELNNCPSFHNTILKYENNLKAFSNSYSKEVNLSRLKSEIKMVTKYPVVAIPFSERVDLFTVLMKNNFENHQVYVESALEHHYKVQQNEISSLCDEGLSAGYYIYENLVSHFRQADSFHKTKAGLMALLKVPVVANMLILDNLKKETEFSEEQNFLTKIEQRFLKRSNVSWFSEYRNELKRARKDSLSARSIAGKKL